MHQPAVAPAPAPPSQAPSAPPEPVPARYLGGAFMVGLVAAIAVTAPVWGNPSRRLLGDWQQPGTLSSHWVIDSLARTFSLHSTMGYAPVGESPLAALGGGAAILAAPLSLALGWPLGVDVYLVLVTAANVAAGAFFARVVGASRLGALFAGLAFGLSPYLLTEITAGRFTQLPAWEVTAALGLWIQVLDRPDRKRALAAAALFGLGTFEYAWYGLMATVGALGLLLIAGRDAGRWRDSAWRRSVGLAAVAALLAAIPGILLLNHGSDPAVVHKVPSPVALDHSLPPLWPTGVEGGVYGPAAVSWVLAAFALVGMRRRGSISWAGPALLAVVLGAWLLSLGPRLLTPGGPIVDSHFPFYVLYSNLFPRFAFPYQHQLFLTLALAALAARGVGALVSRLPSAEPVLLALLLVGVPVELSARGMPLRPQVSHLATEPPWIGEVRALDEGAILGLPLAPELRVSQEALLLQMLHGHPIVDGRSAWLDDQRPAAWEKWVAGNGFMVELERFERGLEVKGDATRANYFRYPVDAVAKLSAQGVRWVMVWDPLFGEGIRGLPRAENKLMKQLFGKPVVSAEGLAVYDITAHTGNGDMVAPVWRMPEDVRPGDGTKRMTGLLPRGVLFEKAQ